MLDLLRAWDLAQEDLLILRPDEDLASAVRKLLERAESHPGSPCGIVEDENGRFLGTLSTHRALRAIGGAIEKAGIFESSRQIDVDRAVHALCRMVGDIPCATICSPECWKSRPILPCRKSCAALPTTWGTSRW